jgi:hypothetical protein
MHDGMAWHGMAWHARALSFVDGATQPNLRRDHRILFKKIQTHYTYYRISSISSLHSHPLSADDNLYEKFIRTMVLVDKIETKKMRRTAPQGRLRENAEKRLYQVREFRIRFWQVVSSQNHIHPPLWVV